jgi:hypothetical protein
VNECETLPLEDMAYVRRKLQDMIHMESTRLYRERLLSLCKHTHVVDRRVGQREDQVQQVCMACHKVVG